MGACWDERYPALADTVEADLDYGAGGYRWRRYAPDGSVIRTSPVTFCSDREARRVGKQENPDAIAMLPA